jgi:hypothetical protein
MRLKNDSVQAGGMRPELILAFIVANEVYKEHGFYLVITSINDSKHGLKSLHYNGCAFDARTTMLSDTYNWSDVAKEIKKRLNTDYDVVNESNHIHVEYQPRRR